jgi:hypothetical protein
LPFKQSNGIVALLDNGDKKWDTDTTGSTTFALMMQANGILALFT